MQQRLKLEQPALNDPSQPMFSMPPITQKLIVINVLVFAATALLGNNVVSLFALWPIGPLFLPWQVLTYAFIHAGLQHLLFNMFGVYMFGSDLERVWGAKRFLTYYLACALSAAITQIVVMHLTRAYYPTVGASGAVFGLLLAYATVFPQRTVMLLFPPIPMRAPVFVAVYGALELVLGVTGTQAGVAHFAHLGGLAGGFLLMRFWKTRR
ncbi:rhomboid family intramembrane serine protease [Propionivibrio sp.]|uniref:rhomboid family intramembrane serine protease n=2 Tax=Propionivibrio sp. TaxID=2212460 RepID=UPI0025F39D0A|nr:rhomboid family intramembrane serine protease [Propionivibrio sp.]